MSRTALLTAALLLAAPAVAQADTYLLAAVGTSPDVNGNLANYPVDGRALKLGVGKSFGVVGVEGGLSGYSLTDGGRSVSASIALRVTAPVTQIFSVYARGGLEKTWMSWRTYDSDGGGYVLGAGVEAAPMFLPFAVFGELNHEKVETSSDVGGKWGGSINTAMIGVKVGL